MIYVASARRVLGVGVGHDGAAGGGALFDRLPTARVVEVAHFRQHAAGVGLLDRTAVIGRVGVLGNDVLAVLDLDHAVPGVEGDTERIGRAGRLGHGGHVAGRGHAWVWPTTRRK